MTKFLFVYGYESPIDWQFNCRFGTDGESSGTIWIEAKTETDALTTGREFAEQCTASLFAPYPDILFSGWAAADYAHWIEHHPFERFSGLALEIIPEITSTI